MNGQNVCLEKGPFWNRRNWIYVTGYVNFVCFINITLTFYVSVNCPDRTEHAEHGVCPEQTRLGSYVNSVAVLLGFKCPSSFTAFLIWAWSAESGMRSPPLWAGGSGSSEVAVCCLWTRSGFSSWGHFQWHSYEPLSAWSHLWPEEPARPNSSGGRVQLSWRPLWERGAESQYLSWGRDLLLH